MFKEFHAVHKSCQSLLLADSDHYAALCQGQTGQADY